MNKKKRTRKQLKRTIKKQTRIIKDLKTELRMIRSVSYRGRVRCGSQPVYILSIDDRVTTT